ncbi:hypothetical protein H2O77_05755 [Cobetia sp. 4B]|uniref:hypothetical protein n=1 Tax=Cobetia sp. 4B TaxID=2758724 RepID=UPI001C04E61D|nr:hypothetical protein [Cobetia sp. 4B]MBR9753198.1 hypothetical protein [Gammaproteobacteria bacterium]MBR9797773.1 hypothetical protein [Gammaproteobacteria bacterium]QWN37963.1 hypothetical protein H2O77_05755 [Cobetia sp. 4B]
MAKPFLKRFPVLGVAVPTFIARHHGGFFYARIPEGHSKWLVDSVYGTLLDARNILRVFQMIRKDSSAVHCMDVMMHHGD